MRLSTINILLSIMRSLHISTDHMRCLIVHISHFTHPKSQKQTKYGLCAQHFSLMFLNIHVWWIIIVRLISLWDSFSYPWMVFYYSFCSFISLKLFYVFFQVLYYAILNRSYCAFTFSIFHFKHMKIFAFVPSRISIACHFVWIHRFTKIHR